MDIILKSKFEVLDRFTLNGVDYKVIDIEFKENCNGDGKIFYLMEALDRERKWFAESVLVERGHKNETETSKTLRAK